MSSRLRWLRVASALALTSVLACSDDAATDAGGGEGGGSETSPPIFDPPPPECGNGYVEDGEECDDGNLDDGDGCDSACKIPCGLLWETSEFATPDDTAPLVADMRVGPAGEIVVLGTLDALIPELDDALWIGVLEPDGAARWSAVIGGEDGLDQLAAGLALGPGGELYLAATVDGDMGDDTNIWIAGLDATGAQQWSVTVDGLADESADVAGGIGLRPDGDLAVAGHLRQTAMDSDLWLARLSAVDGAEMWSTTWTGQTAANGYSLDRGGPVAVGTGGEIGGEIWVMGVEYVDYQTFDGRLFRFDEAGALLDSWAPHADESPGHEHVPTGLSIAADGRVYFGMARTGPGATFWIHELVDGQLGWTREQASFVDDSDGDAWEHGDLAVSDAGELLLGGWLEQTEQQDTWREAWVHRLDAGGAPICERRHTAAGATILNPDVYVDAIAGSPGGELTLAAGRLLDVEQARAFWLGAFRGP